MMWWYCKGLSGARRGQGLQREPGEGSFEEVPLERRGRALVVVITNRATNQESKLKFAHTAMAMGGCRKGGKWGKWERGLLKL